MDKYITMERPGCNWKKISVSEETSGYRIDVWTDGELLSGRPRIELKFSNEQLEELRMMIATVMGYTADA